MTIGSFDDIGILAAFKRELMQEIEKEKEHLSSGTITEYEALRAAIGYIRGLRKSLGVLDWLTTHKQQDEE